ncbi:bifunctional glutamate--cysteine ligase GshA/glutathione synthetase GshB [Chitinivibrio alkaliphilus]|uniref:Glutamate--cysteine ligase n=1 Tax=Chitinivibrio alkaliphilus ACht1 TaxID=1313304 RepID=U7D7K9_9BACT|nr:bifunctional glutamate--cysteine ligase GshA/glutathione synthetase GshB [Chitinivibrio alkaliphilus]ERP31918.1 glutamate-cysteine ligase [Chitinivibrio alkaliphilus ACht1]
MDRFSSIPHTYLTEATIGFEREILRLTDTLEPSKKKHPYVNKISHPYIKTDFSDIQLELISTPKRGVAAAYDELKNIMAVIQDSADVLWNQSMPPAVTEPIPISRFDTSKEGIRLETYREHLAQRYGSARMLISGFHYNFSYAPELLTHLYEAEGTEKSFRVFQDEVYMRVARNFSVLRWMLVYLTGATPVRDVVSQDFCSCKGACSYSSEYAMSLRNGPCGYRNDFPDELSFDTLSGYVAQVESFISTGKIRFPDELYTALRLKNSTARSPRELAEKGIEYLEIRCIDINPFSHNGLDLEQAEWINLFMHYLLVCPDKTPSSADAVNYDRVCLHGLDPSLRLATATGKEVPLREYAMDIFSEMEEVFSRICPSSVYADSIRNMKAVFEHPEKTLAWRCREEILAKGFRDFSSAQSTATQEYYTQHFFTFFGAESLELSTKIVLKEAIVAGIPYRIMDREDNIIALRGKTGWEYVKQATKTSADTYISTLLMENKVVTKKILREASLSVPGGHAFSTSAEAAVAYETVKNTPLVIKPNRTNFGTAVEIFTTGPSRSEYDAAVTRAFREDSTVLAEPFFEGKEYRFFIINGTVAGILHRIPANVTGDGKSTIAELVVEKNRDPLRSKGYVTPLEEITLGEIEQAFLARQGYNKDTILPQGTQFFLRENSNISTGGDSIDYTDEVHDSYKEIALRGSHALGAKICGIDMIIQGISLPANRDNYTIIEANFNPAIHIHCYPFLGKKASLGA